VDDVTTPDSMGDLACSLRTRFFDLVGDDVELVLSSDPANKAYLSGYASMAHDVAPAYRSAVLAMRSQVGLVVSAADAGPALEVIGDPALVWRYGEFYFEASGDPNQEWLNSKPHGSFEDAVKNAFRTLRPRGLIGIDRSNDDLLWGMARETLGENCVVDITRSLMAARATKTPGEIKRLRRATELVENGLRSFISNARVGMTELDISAMITECMAAGGGIPRFVSVTSGPRSALADAYPTPRSIARGELIRIDAGCTVDGYWSDLGRTFVFGEPDERQTRAYRAILAGLEAELAVVKAGITASTVFDVAMAAVRANGIPNYRRQHCGHGIGLQSYDSPLIHASDNTPLQAGMSLCLETPYYEFGRDGMMVEDTVVVTADGYEKITTFSRELISLKCGG
jgi:Xaa-Pro dipeptidase